MKKHLGKHSFPQQANINTANITNVSVLDKLNLPLHKPIENTEFGDLWISENRIKQFNNENNIVSLLDLKNNDIVKNLLISEIMYNDIFNYSESFEKTNSFHTIINYDSNITQHNIDIDLNVILTKDNSNLLLSFTFTESSLAQIQYNNILQYISSNIPLFTRFKNITDSTTVDQMVLFTNAELNVKTLKLTFKDNNIYDIIKNTEKVEISSFALTNNNKDIPYIKLPEHQHKLEDCKDIDNFTNKVDSYLKLKNKQLQLDFEQELYLDKGKVDGSGFDKDWLNQLKKQKVFTLNTSDSGRTPTVNYTETSVNMEGGSTTEYTPTSISIIFNNVLSLYNDTGQFFNKTDSITINDVDKYKTQYLLEIFEYQYSNIFNDDVENNNVISCKYVQVDKSQISTIVPYSNNGNKLNIIGGYYDITIIQPNINTKPILNLNYNNVIKDINESILVITQTSKDLYGVNNISFDKTMNIDIKLDSDSLQLSIDTFDMLSNTQLNVHSSITSNTQLSLDKGIYRITPNNTDTKYTISYY